MVRPVRAAARQAAREVLGVAIRAALVAATVAAIIAYFLSSTIVDPLKKMSVAAHRIARGELNQHVSLNSRDELGDLARSINAMSAEISNLVGNLTAEKEKLQALMKERQNMISDISHDLRTPVTSIKGFVEALRDGVVTDETEKARTLDIIHDESERLTRLVNDLFYLARLESGEAGMDMDDLDLLRVVQDSVTKMIPSAREKSVTLDLAIEAGDSGKKPDRIPVKGSADRLTQAILNLLDNAVKYSPAGGLVKVTVSANASNALVSVLDQGPGISREDLPHVFDRLYRADKSRSKGKPGAGLGLSIAKVIVEKHKGSIWVESIVGQGSKFTISLPIARA